MTEFRRRTQIFEGTVVINGIPTKNICIQNLRSKIVTIPQEFVTWNGSIRYNLDPESKFDDPDIWAVLKSSGICTKNIENGLDTEIENCGLSAGEKQLLCFCRALLGVRFKGSDIVVMDEPAATVDSVNFEKVRELIDSEFWDKTVIVVTHRLEALQDFDRVLVMNGGFLMEIEDLSNVNSTVLKYL